MTWLTTTRRNRPFNMLEDMDTMFDSMFGNLRPTLALDTSNFSSSFTPAVDVQETETSYELQADLPGMQKQDITVDLSDNVLTLKGERTVERDEESNGQRIYERRSGSFQRSFSLPQEVKSEAVEASFNNGVLHISLPKAAPAQPQKKTIEVK